MIAAREALGKAARLARRNVWESLESAVFFCWGFVLLLNSAPFSLITDNVLGPVLFFAFLLACLCVAFPVAGRTSSRLGRLSESTLRFVAYLCAAFSFLVIASSVLFGFPSSVAIVLSSALAAGGVLFFSLANFRAFFRQDTCSAMVAACASLAWALLFFLALIVFLKDVNVLCGCAIMLIFCAAGFLRGRGKGVDSAPGLNDEGATPSEPSSEGGSRVLLPGGIRPASFRALFFVGGFFLSYEFNGTQKTAHFVGTHVFSEQIGGTALASVSYLVLMLVLMVIVVGAYLRPGVSLPGIAFVVLLAVTFFSLPARTPFPFPLLAAGASILFFVTCFALFRVLGEMRSCCDARRLFCSMMLASSSGGLCGALLAFFVLSNTEMAFYDQFFSVFPAILVLAVVAILILLRKCIVVLFRKDVLRERLDASRLEDRCKVVAERYGLTKKESEVLEYLSKGRNVPYIAEALFISNSTAKTHVLHIYRKVGVSSRQDLLDFVRGEEGAAGTRSA